MEGRQGGGMQGDRGQEEARLPAEAVACLATRTMVHISTWGSV